MIYVSFYIQLDHFFSKKIQNKTLLADSLIAWFSTPANVAVLPDSLCELAAFTGACAARIAPDSRMALVGGLVFLRFLNPALVAPVRHIFFLFDQFSSISKSSLKISKAGVDGLLAADARVTEQAQRNLVLLAKVLQNAASGVPFGRKEAFMERMNPTLENLAPRMNRYLELIWFVFFFDCYLRHFCFVCVYCM